MTDITPVEPSPPSKLILGEKVYNTLKFMALILLPAAGTLYFTLGTVWGWPNVSAVVGTITAVDTFLGVVLGISTAAYNKSDARFGGAIQLQPNEAEGTTDLSFSVDPSKLAGASEVTLKVNVNSMP